MTAPVVDRVPLPGGLHLALADSRPGPAVAGDVPLLLLHGYLGGIEDFSDIVGTLAADRRVLVPEHRGFAGSDNPGQGYSFDQLTVDQVALLDHLGVAQVDVLGHSMGGSVALRLALHHPERVRSLVLMDTAARGGSRVGARLAGAAHPVMRLLGPRRFARWVVAPPLRLLARRDARAKGRDVPAAEEGVTRFADRLGRVDPAAFLHLGRELSDQVDLVPRLPEITKPTTVVLGLDDAEDLRQGCRELAAHIPGAVLHEIPDAGHSPQHDDPEAVLAALADHLRRVDGVTPASAGTEDPVIPLLQEPNR